MTYKDKTLEGFESRDSFRHLGVSLGLTISS
jgi:hypothetical protein